jgi:ribonuclease E
MVRVVRPGVEPEDVIEEARQQLASSGSRRRRRGRGGGEGRSGGSEVSSFEFSSDNGTEVHAFTPIPVVEITPLPVTAFESRAAELVTVDVPVHRATTGRGSRSGRSSAGATAVAAPPELEPALTTAVPSAAVSAQDSATPEDDANGEPRRRRRRSSAAV